MGALYARGIDVFVNCRGVLAAPVLRELGFQEIERESMVPMLFPTEIVVAQKPQNEGRPAHTRGAV